MPKYLRTILLSGAEINRVNRLIEDGPNNLAEGAELIKAAATFDNDYAMEVSVVNSRANGPSITAKLIDNGKSVVAEQRLLPGEFDAEFPAEFIGDHYRLTINRAAAEELTDTAISDYIANGGPTCPHCGEVDLHRSNARESFDEGNRSLYTEVQCLSCEATWSDQYSLSGITSINGPLSNVIPPAEEDEEEGGEEEEE